MASTSPCEAYQASDMMYCRKCKLCWDVNDTDPPPCGSEPNDTQLALFDEPIDATRVPSEMAAMEPEDIVDNALALTLVDFAFAKGYRLNDKQRVYLKMLDEVNRGRTNRR